MSQFRSLRVVLYLVFTAALWLKCPAPAAAVWKPADGPLSTRWTHLVSPANARPEYPRPQMVRRDWLNLNGLWQFSPAEADQAPPVGKDLDGQILVPYPVESALSGVMKHYDRLWYRRLFTVPSSWRGRRVLLHFDAVDWEATVLLNGKPLGVHHGGYDGFQFDITPDLKLVGPQELVVGVYDPTDAGSQPRGKQVLHPGGIVYTPTTGIWQTVWLEPVPEKSIDSLILTPDVDHRLLRVLVRTADPTTAPLTVDVTALDGRTRAGHALGQTGTEFVVPLGNLRPVKLWSPANPFLYSLKISLTENGREIDSVGSYFGMRKIAIGGPPGARQVLLNGEPIFEVGMLDQGFWPDGIYTAPTDDALRYDIVMARALGFNLLRKHVKVEPPRWYYWADRLGILVWQDMPSGDNKTPESYQQFETELRRLIEGRRNHPSIIQWVVFNEGWGEHDTEQLTREVKEMDPSRQVDDASGWYDAKVGDVLDIHNYPEPRAPAPDPDRIRVVGEFGGLGFRVDGHTWSKQSWGYQGMASRLALTRRYQDLLQRAWRLHRENAVSAVVYTQVSDVETESNGLMTYDRAVLKVDLKGARSANLGTLAVLPPIPPMAMLVPTAQAKPVTWRYTMQQPPDDWFKPGIDDSGWKVGPAGFGTEGTPGAVVRTVWNTPDIWIRRTFDLARLPAKGWHFMVHHDEDVEIYLNGVLAGKAAGFITDYEEMPTTRTGEAALKAGTNTLAIHCKQTTGGQYVDVGLIEGR